MLASNNTSSSSVQTDVKPRTLKNQCLLRRKLDIVDSVLKKLEKHAENLEAMVSRRTAQLEDEKRKTDLLLYSMLPRYELYCVIFLFFSTVK